MERLKDNTNVHILVIDDNPGYLETLLERLELFGYQHLTSARNATEAKQLLTERHFDIIVIDMRMEKDNRSGFKVIDAIRQGNLSSIAIVLTANDNVDDCREVLKGRGAWDYIPKETRGSKSGIEELHDSIQEAITYFNRWGNAKDETWIQEHVDELRSLYPGKWVAVFNSAVIESADTREEIEQRIYERRLPNFLTIITQVELPITEQLSAELTVFVEGPTDVRYMTKALHILERTDLLTKITVETIGNETGEEGSGHKNLEHGFNFLKNKPEMRPNKVLFLFDQDVKHLPNKGCDFGNLYVRRMDAFSPQKKGSEFLFPESIFEEAFEQDLVQKDLGRATKDNPQPIPAYLVKKKMSFCDWICDHRENCPEDFQEFQKIIRIIESILDLEVNQSS